MLRVVKRLPEWTSDVGLLVLRVGIGLMMLLRHGWPKLASFSEIMDSFPDPLGVGSTMSLTLAVFGEAVCSVLIILGVATRFSALPFLITMLVAAFVVHGGDPWARKELALSYAVPALTLLLTGPGRFSVDAWLRRWWEHRK